MKIKHLPTQYRSIAETMKKGDGAAFDLEFSCASAAPAERNDWEIGRYNEVLSFAPGACDVARMNAGGAYLFNHNPDEPLGRVVRCWTDAAEGKGYAQVKFLQGGDAAEFRSDIEAGDLPNVSIGYRCLEMILTTTGNEDAGTIPTFTVTRWEILEVSTVMIPVDTTVGIGRAEDTKQVYPVAIIRDITPSHQATSAATVKAKHMDLKELAALQARNEELTKQVEGLEKRAKELGTEAHEHMLHVMGASTAAGCPDLGIKALKEGYTERQFTTALADFYKSKGATTVVAVNPDLGLGKSEIREYSLNRAIAWSAGLIAGDCLEGEMHQALLGRGVKQMSEKNSVLIPNEILGRQVSLQKRDLTAGTQTAGGYLVATTPMSLIELLRNKAITPKLGVVVLPGNKGDLLFPRKTGAGTFYWFGENGAPTESNLTFGALRATPRTGGAFVDVGRQLLLQSDPAAEAITTEDIATGVAIGTDLAVLSGSGVAGQPTGIFNTSGIGSVTFATNLTFDNLLEMEADVAIANAEATSCKYLATPAIRRFAKGRLKAAAAGSGFLWEANQMNGYDSFASNQMTAQLLGYGDFSQALVVEWGGLEIETDRSAGFTSGTIRVRALKSMDVIVRQVGAFVAEASITA